MILPLVPPQARSPARSLTTLYKCIHCHKLFASFEEVQTHIVGKHLNIQRPDIPKLGGRRVQCEECGETFGNTRRLADHLSKHAGARPFTCELCDRSFTSRGRLEAHTDKHTSGWKNICSHCKMGFASTNDLEIHVRTHIYLDFYRLPYQFLG